MTLAWVKTLVLVVGTGICGSHGAFAQGLESHVVRVFVGKREVDRSAPWQYDSVRQQSSLAVMLPGGLLLSTAFAVADASTVELQRFGASRKEPADVAFVDYEVNLALLRPRDPKALEGIKPAPLGDDLAVDDAVEIYKARDAYQLAKMPAKLQEVGVFGAVTSSYSLVSYLIKVQQTGLGWSEPIFRGGQLVALTTGQDNDFVHAIPMSIVRHMLDDKLGAGYRGFPAIGVSLTSLTSPEQRRLLKADRFTHGVRIAKVAPGGPFSDKLKSDDVLLEVAGTRVSEHGYYTHPRWGMVHLKHILNRKYGGDSLKLKILRDGAEIEVEATLERFDSNRSPVVAYRYGQPEPHLIFGGLIFQELSQDYLKQWGKDWRDVAPLDLLYTLEFEDEPSAAPDRRFIFLNRVLADVVNRGYGDLRRQVVKRVNGRTVSSMKDLKEALAFPVSQGGKPYARIEFARDGGEVILGYDGLDEAHARIGKTYSVITPGSFFAMPR